MRVLDDKQVRTLLLTARGSRYEALFRMAVTTGMRESELLGLRWSDMDWDGKRVSVQRQLQLIDGKYVFTNPKSAAGRRVIALGEGMINALRHHQTVLADERRAVGDHWVENDLVFPSTRGTPGDKHNLLKAFKRLLEAAGLPDIRFHDLRHTAATLLLQQGVNPKVVQERLGHADISMTLSVYSHVLPSMQEEAAEKVDELLTPIDVSDEITGLKERGLAYRGSTRGG
jgi:integrase